jgi:phytoene desaturase
MARVVVVGAGFSGLATAIRLAAAGLAVTLCERDSAPGGRAGRVTEQGYTFDTGPSVVTMPELFDELFALAGEERSNHVELVRLDPAYRAVFHDGSELRVRGSVEAMAAEIRTVCGAAEAARFRTFAARLEALYQAEFGPFIDANFDSPLDLARPVKLLRLLRLGGFRRLHPLVSSHLRDWRLVRLFTFQAMYAGMSPFQALGLYAVIAYMDVIRGVYGVRGGVHTLAVALAGLAARLGVDLRYGTAVARVEVTGGRASAVHTVAGERLPCDVVVLTPDLPVAYRELLPPAATPRRLERLRFSPSCVVVHLGLDRALGGAEHHNIHFAARYRAGFDDILRGRPQRDPSWFLSVPTVTDAAAAPAGGVTAFQLVPCPNLAVAAIDWDRRAQAEGEAAQARMEAAGYGPVRAATVVRRVVTPADWARAGMAAGTPFAASHHFLQTGPFRPANVAPRVGGVVFAGSSTTPGVGVPMVLISGKLAAERVLAATSTARPVGAAR